MSTPETIPSVLPDRETEEQEKGFYEVLAARARELGYTEEAELLQRYAETDRKVVEAIKATAAVDGVHLTEAQLDALRREAIYNTNTTQFRYSGFFNPGKKASYDVGDSIGQKAVRVLREIDICPESGPRFTFYNPSQVDIEPGYAARQPVIETCGKECTSYWMQNQATEGYPGTYMEHTEQHIRS